MPFTATYHVKTSASASVPLTAAYFRIDGNSIMGGKDAGYSATVRVYVDRATRLADPGDDIPDSSFSVNTPYVADQDPYPALYAAAKANYPDAIDL
jgi:hypothetical protein